MVKRKGKIIAIGDNGKFSTTNESIIRKLDLLGFPRIESDKKETLEKEIKPSKSLKKGKKKK
jgi:hypothetical protein